jgi:hypothetical protein
VAPAAQAQNEGFMLWCDLALAQFVGAAALRVQPRFTLHLVASPPLEKRRLADAATTTTQSCVLALFVMLHPAQTRFEDWFGIIHQGFSLLKKSNPSL